MTRQTTLSFPELRLPRSDGHRLRGYFGNAFKKHSPLLHNHLEDGTLRNGYPLVQYKMIRGVPTIIGLNEGADILLKIFADIDEIKIAEQTLDANAKDLRFDKYEPTVHPEQLFAYRLESPYQAFNQEQYPNWRDATTDEERFAVAQKALIGHLLMLFKGLGIWLEEGLRIVAYPTFRPTTVAMKGQRLTAFTGEFITNAELPDLIGIGKGTSRGFGVIRRLTGRINAL
jgi:hypothetical protein